MLPSEREVREDDRHRDRLSLICYGAALGLPGVLSLWIKHKLLADEGGGYDLVAAALGLEDGTRLGLVQRVALYRWDVLLAFVLVPGIWLLLMRPLDRRLRALLTALIGILASLFLFIELKCFWEVGTFLPARVLLAGALGAGRKFAAEYMNSGSVLKLGVLLAGVVAASLIGRWFDRGARGRGMHFPGWRPVTAVCLGTGALAMLPIIPPTPFDRSAGAMALEELLGLGADVAEVETPATLATPALMERYRALTNAPVPNGRSPYFGIARGFNVLVYLYETLPLACYAAASDGPDPYGAFRGLEASAFIADRHYATYPYSRRAYFSIYSGWYPPHGMRDFTEEAWDDTKALASPGMVRTARNAGYETSAFVPEHPEEWEGDVVRYRVLGFEHHVVPSNAGTVNDALRGEPLTRLEWQRPQDDSARALLRRDIARVSASGKPWLFSFNPQLSHGPWPGASSAATIKDICARGAPIFREVDNGLREVLATLDSAGQRDRTLVVVMGDHGLRTRMEYPGFRGATLDDITFQVPMLIHVPGLDSTVRIPWVTSQIDIAPSVLDLLGLEQGRELEQGSPLWEPRLQDRRVFVFAQGYLGVDGYMEKGGAAMLNYMLRGVALSTSGRLAFSPLQVLHTPDSTAASVSDLMRRFTGVQHAFLQRLPGYESMASAVVREALRPVESRTRGPGPAARSARPTSR